MKIEDYGTFLYARDDAGDIIGSAEKIRSGEHRRSWSVRCGPVNEIVDSKAKARRRLRDLAGGAS